MPFLVCDEPNQAEGVTQYKVYGLGAGGFADPLITAADPSPTYGFKLDLANLKTGTYTVKARAMNGWAESADSAPFVFTAPAAPSPPIGTRILP
jgi:predicted phage tail protein